MQVIQDQINSVQLELNWEVWSSVKGISGLDTGPRTNRSCTENLHEASFLKGIFQVKSEIQR